MVAVASGLFTTVEEAIEALCVKEDYIEPNKQLRGLYDNGYEAYNRLKNAI